MNIRDIKFKVATLMQMAKVSNCEEDRTRYLKEVETLLQKMDEVTFQCKQIIESSAFNEDAMDLFAFDEDAVEEIKNYIQTRNCVCAIEIWQEALNKTGKPQKWQSVEIGKIVLQIPGWKKLDKAARFGKYGSQRGFRRTTNGKQV